MKSMTVETIIRLHDERVIEAHELQGLAPDKSLDGAIARIDNRLNYGMIVDVYHLAACYATFIAEAHAFNDGNKRTAFAVMDMILALNGIELDYDTEQAGDMIVKIVTKKIDEDTLADWLRKHSA